MSVVLDADESIAEHAGGFVMPAWSGGGEMVLLWIEDAALDPLAERFGMDVDDENFISRCRSVLEKAATAKLESQGIVDLPTASEFETPMRGIMILAADVNSGD